MEDNEKKAIETRIEVLKDEYRSQALKAMGRAGDAVENAQKRGIYSHHVGYNLGNDATELCRIGGMIEELERMLKYLVESR